MREVKTNPPPPSSLLSFFGNKKYRKYRKIIENVPNNHRYLTAQHGAFNEIKTKN